MRRLSRFLFSTGPRFGVTVGCLGGLVSLAAAVQHLAGGPGNLRLGEIGLVLFLCGFAWAILTAYVGPRLNGGGMVCAVLFLLIVPAADSAEIATVLATWNYLIWGVVCLAILVWWLASAYLDEKRRSMEMRTIYDRALKQAGVEPPT